MRTLYAFCLLCVFALTSCEEEPMYKTCVVANPTQELEWLRVKVQELEKSQYCQFVQSGHWKGRTVFVLGNCDPLINSISSVYDCDGNLLCYGGDETCPDFSKEVKNLKIVWKNGK
ncbi:DUF6970 domain-containing protein [Rufibacter hautae]|uniref:DUF6970 domain-containing protein n=1 Tax=Rufibacter hautae TaxID=2595005 RepID=A0A5B6TAV2_9BACT|nr:hypothetical protein [Rufibacter hautae]KAA3436139.1 hypothetical protein FOA19_17195 [Rufibacter hautae]